MKAVIVEIRNVQAAALTDDGCIIKIKNKNYAAGQVIELKHGMTRKARRAVLAASAAAVVLVAGVGAWAYTAPYSYVSLDVNPSIEYTVNRFDRVLRADAVNGDGEKILKSLSLENKSIEEAVQSTVFQIEKAGYFNGQEPGSIEIATFSENTEKADSLAKTLWNTAEQAAAGTESPVEVEAVRVGYERVQQAKALGTTPGKLNLVQKLQAASAGGEINLKEWLAKPVKDIMKAIKAAQQGRKADGTDGSNAKSENSTASGANPQESSGQKTEKQAQPKAESSSHTKGSAASRAAEKPGMSSAGGSPQSSAASSSTAAPNSNAAGKRASAQSSSSLPNVMPGAAPKNSDKAKTK